MTGLYRVRVFRGSLDYAPPGTHTLPVYVNVLFPGKTAHQASTHYLYHHAGIPVADIPVNICWHQKTDTQPGPGILPESLCLLHLQAEFCDMKRSFISDYRLTLAPCSL